MFREPARNAKRMTEISWENYLWLVTLQLILIFCTPGWSFIFEIIAVSWSLAEICIFPNIGFEHGHVPVVERLLADPRVDPAASDSYAIRLASEHGHVTVVERLLADPRVDPAASDSYAIRLASEHGHVTVVERLLADPRVDPAASDSYAIRLASEHGRVLWLSDYC
jgi:hypothetical protein